MKQKDQNKSTNGNYMMSTILFITATFQGIRVKICAKRIYSPVGVFIFILIAYGVTFANETVVSVPPLTIADDTLLMWTPEFSDTPNSTTSQNVSTFVAFGRCFNSIQPSKEILTEQYKKDPLLCAIALGYAIQTLNRDLYADLYGPAGVKGADGKEVPAFDERKTGFYLCSKFPGKFSVGVQILSGFRWGKLYSFFWVSKRPNGDFYDAFPIQEYEEGKFRFAPELFSDSMWPYIKDMKNAKELPIVDLPAKFPEHKKIVLDVSNTQGQSWPLTLYLDCGTPNASQVMKEAAESQQRMDKLATYLIDNQVNQDCTEFKSLFNMLDEESKVDEGKF